MDNTPPSPRLGTVELSVSYLYLCNIPHLARCIRIFPPFFSVGDDYWDAEICGFLVYDIAHLCLRTASPVANNLSLAVEDVRAFLTNASGPLSTFAPGLSQSTYTVLAAFSTDWPELEVIPVSAYDYGVSPDPADGNDYATITTSCEHVRLTSYQSNSHTHPADIEVAVQGFHRQREIWSALKSISAVLGDEVLPGLQAMTDAQISEYISASLIEAKHASATCKNGRANDPMAVVNSKARVYGVKGLRVVDASAFPFLLPQHPQSTVYALAEMIAADNLTDVGEQ
ncbi:MAG: hypothetical protein M1820_005117 [Bogoriella megaspora]|nr:MAG: hypothetical protein M1820_005117 [Bogoriella megaspora]